MSEEHPTMREDQEVELLSRVDLFESLSEEEIRVLVRQNSDVRLGEGETFYAPWEHDGKLFILKKGRMRLYRTEGSREFTLEVVEAGTVFGEMAFSPPSEGVLRQGHCALRRIRDGACCGGAPDRGEASGGHQDDKPPLRAPALLRDSYGGRYAKGGASEAC